MIQLRVSYRLLYRCSGDQYIKYRPISTNYYYYAIDDNNKLLLAICYNKIGLSYVGLIYRYYTFDTLIIILNKYYEANNIHSS